MFLNNNNKILEKEIKKIISFTTVLKKKKKENLGINLTKVLKCLYTENYKTPIKKINYICVFMEWKNQC